MAITNAQQARQLYNEGGPMRKIKGQDHMLAYITPNEADKLVKLGGQETMTPEGIPAYPPSDYYGGTHSSKPSRTTTNNPPSNGGGGGFTDADDRRQSYQSRSYTTPKGQEVPEYKKEAPYTYIGGNKYEVTPETFYEREEAENLANLQRQKEINEENRTRSA